jgi:hypothetical protein
MKKEIVCTWSGGIDSTALVALLLKEGFVVNAITLRLYQERFSQREYLARQDLMPILKKIGGDKFKIKEKEGSFLWAFSPDGEEIPWRNKRIIDHLIETENKPNKIYYIGMGEYIGADSWVTKDHVSMGDADARSLASYIYQEYGLDYRLMTLADFGESRFKNHRVKLGAKVIGEEMFKTTNCLKNSLRHCGECYKCIERHVAMNMIFHKDITEYNVDPKNSPLYNPYMRQMYQ